MFYSTDILSRRRDGFALYWLAATLGSKGGTSFKKLSRKEILGCNIVAACNKLSEPDEPLALRLSSNLLCGISRVYEQQYALFHADVALMQSNLKKNFNDLCNQIAQTKALDLAPPPTNAHASTSNLTLAADTALENRGWDMDWDLGIDWNAFDIGGGVKGDDVGEEGEEGEMDFDSLEQPSMEGLAKFKQRRQPTTAHQVQDIAAITLQEHHLQNYEYEDEDHGLFGEKLEGVTADEPGFLEGHSAELDADIAIAEGAASARHRAGSGGSRKWGSAAGGPSSSSAGGMGAMGMGGYYDDQGMGGEDPWAGNDFGGGDEQTYQGETMAERVQREHDESLEQKKGLNAAAEVEMEVDGDAAREEGDALLGSDVFESGKKRNVAVDKPADDDVEPKTKATSKKAKKFHTVIVDDEISLSDDYVNKMRSNYEDRMRIEREKVEKINKDKADAARATDIIFGVPDNIQHPVLRDWWMETVVVGLVPFGGRKVVGEKKKRSPRKKIEEEVDDQPNEAEVDVAATGAEKGVGAPVGGAAFSDVFHDMGGGEDYFGQQQNQDNMGGMEMQDFDFGPNNAETGRADEDGVPKGSQRNSMMPWNAAQSSDPGNARNFFGGFGSSQTATVRAGTATPRGSDKIRHSRAASLLRSLAGSAIALKSEVDGAPVKTDAENAIIAGLEGETLSFLEFTKKQAEAEGGDLHFSDLVPIASSNEIVAAQAFYHLLSLASKGLVRVKQREAYGEIEIEMEC